MIMIAVEDLDVDAILGHPAGQLPELSRDGLVEALRDDLSHTRDADARRFKGVPCGVAIFEQEVGYSLTLDDERSTALHAHAPASQRLTHLRQRARPVVQGDR